MPVMAMRVWLQFAIILLGAQHSGLVLACRSAATATSYQSVILITGGSDEYTELTSVEVLSPSGVPLPCTVPPRPATRSGHTQNGEVYCGGDRWFSDFCMSLTASGWTTSHQLREERFDHVGWSSPAGILLMGGEFSSRTTELLTDTGSSLPSFDLEYDTR